MERTKLVIVVLSSLCIFVVIAIALFLVFSSNILSSPSSNLNDCKTLINNGGKINLVFLSDKKNAEKYSDFLLNHEPFDKYKKEFSVYYIDTYIPDCELYKEAALFCYSSRNVKAASSCPNDFIIVTKSEEQKIRSSAYMNFASINTNLPQSVLLHEFGHVFANLADEYTKVSLQKNSKNCVSDCKNFDGKNEGCFEGCSNEDYFRSIDEGIMRTLSSSNFGEFDNHLIQEKMSKYDESITGSAVENLNNECKIQEYYLIEGIYLQNNTISIIKKTLEYGCVGSTGTGTFSYTIFTSDGNTISGTEFNPELIFTDAQASNESIINGGTLLSDKHFFIKVPVISNSKTIEISKLNESLAKTEIEGIGARPCKIN